MMIGILLILLILSFPYSSEGLAPEYATSLDSALNWFILQNPKYVMSDKIQPDDPITSGVDCSRYIYLACKRAGVPVLRTTSYQMALGAGGWYGKDIKLDDAEALDIPFWTWKNKPDRPHGHVGMFLVSHKSKLMEVTHASQGRGVVLDQLKGKLMTDISKIRHLKIGDK